ncbi:MAG: hypothetical protein H7Y07_06210 [Pyrinomonadaceae bacterium]|nr:hypothetical protein [Sphingobacteriaceae bacterium]
MPVSLQINLAPGDYLHAKFILKHQLDILSNQVDEIILTIETKPSNGRFADGWDENKLQLYSFLKKEIEPHFDVQIIPVDYSEKIKKTIADYFFGTDFIPEKDFRGGPFYAYFFGLHSASNNLIFHIDSDLFLGGGSQKWVQEASDFFDKDPDCFIVSPLPGPPHPDGTLKDQTVVKKISSFTYELKGMSTRIFLIDKSKFNTDKLSQLKPSIKNQIKAYAEGNSNADLPEHLIASYMQLHLLKRIDFLGSNEGLWSLHPPYRSSNFYSRLPEIIEKIQHNDLPENQYGFYDIVDEVCDWSEAREIIKNYRWWKKLLVNQKLKIFPNK